MSANMNKIVDQIIADAEKKVRADLKHISSMAKKDFYEKAKEVVLLYYAHYKPKIYERTYNLQDNVIDDGLSFVALNGNGYDAWIQFNADNMSDYNIGSKEAVVSNFMHGIHGKRSIAMEDNPAMDLMDDFQQNYKYILDNYFIKLGYTIK